MRSLTVAAATSILLLAIAATSAAAQGPTLAPCHGSTCDECSGQILCGWCSPHLHTGKDGSCVRCQAGSGGCEPLPGSCSGEYWFAQQCPAAPAAPTAVPGAPTATPTPGPTSSWQCNQFKNCNKCAQEAPGYGECGWCATTNKCHLGTPYGPFSGTCSSGNWSYQQGNACPATPVPATPAPTPMPTPPPAYVPCDTFTSCDNCTMPQFGINICGWCTSTMKCEAGQASGPYAADCPIPNWVFMHGLNTCPGATWPPATPAPPVPMTPAPTPVPSCSHFTCSGCTNDASGACGWCSNDGQGSCEFGTSSGPGAGGSGFCGGSWDWTSSDCGSL